MTKLAEILIKSWMMCPKAYYDSCVISSKSTPLKGQCVQIRAIILFLRYTPGHSIWFCAEQTPRFPLQPTGSLSAETNAKGQTGR